MCVYIYDVYDTHVYICINIYVDIHTYTYMYMYVYMYYIYDIYTHMNTVPVAIRPTLRQFLECVCVCVCVCVWLRRKDSFYTHMRVC